MSIEERRLIMTNRGTSLNPNAEEFVPSSLRSVSDVSKRSDAAKVAVSGPPKETSTDLPDSILRSKSDEEAHQYWQQQLPDDITPDFNVLGQDDTPGLDTLPLTGLSINDSIGASIFSPNQTPSMQHRAPPFIREKMSTRPKIEVPGPTYTAERLQAAMMSPTAGSISPTAAPWVKTVRNGGQYSTNRRDAGQYNGDPSIGASLHNLPDAYHGGRRSLSSTMDIMSQLENKVDGRFSQNLRSLSFGHSSPPSPASYAQNGHVMNYSKEAFGLPTSPYRSHSATLTDNVLSLSTGREHLSMDTPRGRYKMTNLPVSGLGSSRGSQLMGGPYNGHHDVIPTNTLQNMTAIQTGPTWLESDAAASSYLESNDEVHDFASLRHALEQQDRQAFLMGNKPSTDELTFKELYARFDARETTHRPRFSVPEPQGLIQESSIDLCGLHASEAMHVLNHELNNRRKNARSTGLRHLVIIRSSARAPARLTVAVEQYLMERGLQYTQAQPGLFRVLLQ